MTDEQIIAALGGPTKVAELCECSPQAVSQWFGVDATGIRRSIPRARLLFLKAIRPDIFSSAAHLAADHPAPVSPTTTTQEA